MDYGATGQRKLGREGRKELILKMRYFLVNGEDSFTALGRIIFTPSLTRFVVENEFIVALVLRIIIYFFTGDVFFLSAVMLINDFMSSVSCVNH